MALTPKQEKVLKFISDYKDDKGLSPTIVELQMGLGFKSIHSVTQFLNSLEKKGYVHRGGGFRSLTLTNSVGFQLTFDIPVIGLANASNPTVYAEENRIGNIAVSQSIIKGDKDKYFFLKIEGTSMNQFKVNGKIIFDGSMVLVNGQDRTVNEQDAFLCILNG
ncbi:MAG: S24 family peptidase, partial [Candidatus Gracilibacteria bacterium]|nr:S24 family peptidase [Candidatus Gracilibacteria bacterium]